MVRNELEEIIINSYNVDVINTRPKTEKELLNLYYYYTDPLYQYLRLEKRNHFIYAISNEIRAMLGHLANYRVSLYSGDKEDLEKAYGHFRRLNLDALKILCNQFDATFARKLTQEYSYDYRNEYADYLKDFSSKYFVAKDLYEKAQQNECVGSDSSKHNIFDLYHKPVVEYIKLRRFYDERKKIIRKIRRNSIIISMIISVAGVFGIIISILQLL